MNHVPPECPHCASRWSVHLEAYHCGSRYLDDDTLLQNPGCVLRQLEVERRQGIQENRETALEAV